ncbi:MAG: YdcF family protein [Pseudomonadota bacterium]
MSAGWLFNTIVSAFLLPPLNLIVPGLLGVMLRKRWPRFGTTLIVVSLLGLLVLCTAAGARLFVAPLEQRTTPLASARGSGAQAIVVLGGGRLRNAPEYGGRDSPSLIALGRLRYAARLHRETGLPVLVAGGVPDGASESEASVMARVLREEFSIPVKWLEQASDNTAENARFSAQLLKQANVQRILLVTDALHMPRSQTIFRKYGLQVVPAPTAFASHNHLRPLDFLPSGDGLRLSHYAMHEWVGQFWYWLRYRAAAPS